MSSYNRNAWQIACAIDEKRQDRTVKTVNLPQEAWLESEQLLQKINKANRHGWFSAALKLQPRYLQSLERVRDSVSQVYREQESVLLRSDLMPLESIYQELCSLADEFDAVEMDLFRQQIRCRTSEIELEGIPLGRFLIVLDWMQLQQNQPYHIEALEPNPAASSDGTPHPHLQDGSLCEGDGRAAIRAALQQGRIADFFLLVQQILQTYNPNSPYVSLDRWFGTNCSDCDYLMERGDACCCQDCDREICAECSESCQNRFETVCHSCRQTCEGCLDSFCANCIDPCFTCEKSYCQECLKDDICQCCLEEQKENEEETEPVEEINSEITENKKQATENTHLAVHAVCVGETIVSA